MKMWQNIYTYISLGLRSLTPYSLGLIIIFWTWGIYLFILWPKMLFERSGNIYAGWIGIYGDWAAHFAYAAPFAYRPILSWLGVHPLFADRKLTYPFVADAISGILIHLGMDQVAAFIIPSIITSLVLLFLLYHFYFSFFEKPSRSILAITIFFTSGGLGFWWTFKKIFSQANVVQGLLFPPLESTHVSDHSIEWLNVISGQLVPQRALLLGVTAGMALLIYVYGLYKKSFKDVRPEQLFPIGMLSGFMVIIHPHSYIAFIIFTATMAAYSWRQWKHWLVFAIGAAVVAIPLYIAFYGGQVGAGFARWYPGWLANPTAHNTNIILFWLFNWGLFLPTALFGIWKFRYYRNPLIVGTLVIFILTNLFLFQPYAQANDKLLIWSYLVLVIPVVGTLDFFWSKIIFTKIIALILFLSIITSGALDLWRLTRTNNLQSMLWSAEDLRTAASFRSIFQSEQRVLTNDNHNNLVATQTGAQILMGFRGWLWTYGINYQEREADMRQMFAGGDMARDLLAKYSVDYVIIDNGAIQNFGAQENYFQQTFPIVFDNPSYRVYQVNTPKPY